MLSIIEKAKLLKEFRELRLALTGGSLGIVDKARKLKRFREIRVLLGGQNATPKIINNSDVTEFGYFSPKSHIFDISNVTARGAYTTAINLLKNFLDNPANETVTEAADALVNQVNPTKSKNELLSMSLDNLLEMEGEESRQIGDEKKALLETFGKLKRISTKVNQDAIQDLTKIIKKIYEGRSGERRNSRYTMFWSDLHKEHPEQLAKKQATTETAQQYMQDLKEIKRKEGFVDFVDGPDVSVDDIDRMKSKGFIPFVFSPNFQLNDQNTTSIISKYQYHPNLTLWARKSVSNPVYQRVIDGEEITRELLIELNEASLKDPDPFNAQLVQASQITLKFMRDLVMQSKNQEAA